MISIVDYRVGNIQAIANIYRRLNIPVGIARTAEQLASAERVILPGVGSFDWAMARLNHSGLRDVLDDLVLSKCRPVLGICVGMQMLAKRSEEGSLEGLGWIDGEVKKFERAAATQQAYLPHMGWNDVEPRCQECLFKGIGATGRFYFLHSYYFVPKDPSMILGVSDYGGPFASCVHAKNVFGVQFHPEKSHQWGIQLLKNFAEM
ncbi:MAG TPA: imidazole glycerol phosphate synthase subunit HisH [Candidatus Solibacter sp.]|nr:imidazole glycerol phosphate synthase subunit HisH [Candidatus Solibacter sp.]